MDNKGIQNIMKLHLQKISHWLAQALMYNAYGDVFSSFQLQLEEWVYW